MLVEMIICRGWLLCPDRLVCKTQMRGAGKFRAGRGFHGWPSALSVLVSIQHRNTRAAVSLILSQMRTAAFFMPRTLTAATSKKNISKKFQSQQLELIPNYDLVLRWLINHRGMGKQDTVDNSIRPVPTSLIPGHPNTIPSSQKVAHAMHNTPERSFDIANVYGIKLLRKNRQNPNCPITLDSPPSPPQLHESTHTINLLHLSIKH